MEVDQGIWSDGLITRSIKPLRLSPGSERSQFAQCTSIKTLRLNTKNKGKVLYTDVLNHPSVMTEQLSLQVSTSAIGAMAEFEQLLISNSGVDAFDLAVKLLAAKLWDEQHNNDLSFKIHQEAAQTHAQIEALCARAFKEWPNLADGGSASLEDISAQQLVRSIRPLLGWRLSDSDLSFLDATLERLVARSSKGALGQYFTPREVIRLCVEVLNPSSDELVLDPACGSGGFLFEAVHNSRMTGSRPPSCLGIDLSAKSARVAALLSAATPDAAISISKANSLDGRQYAHSTPPEWDAKFLCQKESSHTKRANTWGAWNQLGCDVLLTNPPFAGDIDEFEILEAYESQQDQTARKVVSREHLFLERAIDLLRPGGRLAIVVPQGILANSTAAYLRAWLIRKCRILAVIGLHPHAFSPFTGVKTAILFLEKPSKDESPPREYPVLFSVSQNAGKDSSGRKVGVSDYQQISETLRSFLLSEGFTWPLEVAAKASGAETEIVMLSEVLANGRLDAEHYDPVARRLEKTLAKKSSLKIGDMVENKVPKFRKKDYESIAYVDISSVDARTGISFPQVIEAADAPSRASFLVEPGDVLVSTVRPDRNVVALMTEESDSELPVVASNGFCVLRTKSIAPELLYAYCKTDAFRKVLTMHSAASMYPTVSERDVLNVPFLETESHLEKGIVEQIRSGLAMLAQGQRQIKQAIEKLNAAVSSAGNSK